LPWTGIIMLFAPVVGILVERVGGKRLVVAGLVLQAAGLLWLGLLVTSGTPYLDMVPAFVLAGIGMTLFFVPLASLVLGSVPPSLEGVASGTNSAFREVGGVLGIAVLGAVFSSSGSYSSPQNYVNGLRPAILVGAVAVLLGTFTALFVPALRRTRTGETALPAPHTDASDFQDEGSTRQDLVNSSVGSAA
jgi:MFS family permease